MTATATETKPEQAEPNEPAPMPEQPKPEQPPETQAESEQPTPEQSEPKPAEQTAPEPTPEPKPEARKKLAPAPAPPSLDDKSAAPAPAKPKPPISLKKSKRKTEEISFHLLEFRTNGRPTLEDLAKLTFPKLTPDKGAIIVGGRTEWVAALTGHCILNCKLPWIAIYDRRHGKNGAGLVTIAQSSEVSVWQLIEFDLQKK